MNLHKPPRTPAAIMKDPATSEPVARKYTPDNVSTSDCPTSE